MALFSDPQKNIDQCGIHAGQVIADFGSGSGFHALCAAKALGSTGKVYAIDIQKDLLVRLHGEAHKQNINNIDVIWGDIEKENGTKLASSIVDLALVSNILFQLTDIPACITEIKRVLVPGGRVMVVDWAESFGGIGPQATHVVTKDKALQLFQSAGFAKERDVVVGDHHYGILFKKM